MTKLLYGTEREFRTGVRDADRKPDITACMLNWTSLGQELRESADEAHEGHSPSLDLSYSFLINNPECFGYEEWPADMPEVAPEALQMAYGTVFEYVTDQHGYMVARVCK